MPSRWPSSCPSSSSSPSACRGCPRASSPPRPWPEPDWTQAILLLMFAYGGFESPLIPAAEARDPYRDTGPALIMALGVIATVYLLVQLVVVGVLPHAAESKTPFAAAFGVILGPGGALLASLAALVSIYGLRHGHHPPVAAAAPRHGRARRAAPAARARPRALPDARRRHLRLRPRRRRPGRDRQLRGHRHLLGHRASRDLCA